MNDLLGYTLESRVATLCDRILSLPYPVSASCTGHAYPAGAFLMPCADRRIGSA